jgi:hypothetical protein
VQLQLLSADGSSVFAVAAHRELQLSFLQKYGFVVMLYALCACEVHPFISYNVGIMALFLASKWFQYKQQPRLPASSLQR